MNIARNLLMGSPVAILTGNGPFALAEALLLLARNHIQSGNQK
jgi:hypothetical protein